MKVLAMTISAAASLSQSALASVVDDEKTVSAIDIAYQAAVKRNDHLAMRNILHDRFFLILGDGTVVSREELLREAENKTVQYSTQDEDPGTQAVRVWGDTAVVTARLRIKGVRDGKPFDRILWFSDTYVRTGEGWKYAFAQASLPLPAQ